MFPSPESPSAVLFNMLPGGEATEGNRNLQDKPYPAAASTAHPGYQVCVVQGDKRSSFRVVPPRTGSPTTRMWLPIQCQPRGPTLHPLLLSVLLQGQGLLPGYGYSPSDVALNPGRGFGPEAGNAERPVFSRSWISPPTSVFLKVQCYFV